MWIQWLVHGKPDAPKASEQALNKTKEMIDELEKEKKWEEAFDILKTYDPTRAAKLPRNDWYRLRRYLEIAIDLSIDNKDKKEEYSSEDESKPTLVGTRTQYLQDLDVRCFFLTESRESLYHTIDNRCEQMLYAGLLQEVKILVSNGLLTPDYPISKSIGYRQTIEYFARQDWEPKDLKAFGQFLTDFATATRNYAKRQIMWYRKDKLFLFLQIFRNQLDTSDNPYDKVAMELLHWFTQERTEFDQVLGKQLATTEYTTEYIKKGFVFDDYICKDEIQFRVIKDLVASEKIKIKSKAQESKESIMKKWKELNQSYEDTFDLSNFSAFGKLFL